MPESTETKQQGAATRPVVCPKCKRDDCFLWGYVGARWDVTLDEQGLISYGDGGADMCWDASYEELFHCRGCGHEWPVGEAAGVGGGQMLVDVSAPRPVVIVEVRGGVAEVAHTRAGYGEPRIKFVDWDDIESGDDAPELPEGYEYTIDDGRPVDIEEA